jgi:hypothetical protein
VRPPLFRSAIGGRVEATPNEKENDHETQQHQQVERGEDKRFWTRIGAAWEHKDGEGIDLQLDLVPTSGGRIVLRAPREDEAGA